MTPEQLAQDAAAKAERLAIEKARQAVIGYADHLHRHLDERTERNEAACPHLNLTTSAFRHLGSDYEAKTCVACGAWIPNAAATEGDSDARS